MNPKTDYLIAEKYRDLARTNFTDFVIRNRQ